jgi:hypothetical protein
MIFHWAAIIVDAWLAVVRGARSAVGGRTPVRGLWRTLPGDLLGLVVMRGCGVHGPTRMVEAGDVTAILVEDPRIGRWFDTHVMPIRAQTLGRYVLSRGPVPADILAHECEHIRQWERYGPFYLALYAGASAAAVLRRKQPYWDNHFEAAARRRADTDMAALRDTGPV